MRNLYIIYIIAIVFGSCQKEKIEIRNLDILPEEISRIELRTDHKTLVPNGICKMGFHTLVYAKRRVVSYGRDADTKEYTRKEIEEEFLVPNDQIPEGLIKIYDSSGNQIESNYYSTTNKDVGSIQFYAKGDNIMSNVVDIEIRELPDESYEEIIVPVVFHLLKPPSSSAPSYDLSVEFLENTLKQVSDIFNREITTDPNGGNSKVVFKLALYDRNGLKMQEPGKNIENISVANFTNMGTSSTKTRQYLDYILASKSRLIWDPNKYLNIWIAKFTASTSTSGVNTSYALSPPTIMHSDYDLSSIPGLTMTHKDQITVNEVTDCRQVGIMLNLSALLTPTTVQGRNEFSFATPLAEYYGLLRTQCNHYSLLNSDGDNDYCPDTYSYDYRIYPSIHKANNLAGQPEDTPNRPLEYFTSFNVMDEFSYKNSLTVDQVARVRKVMEQCPSRWAYKSEWAFTGK